MKTSGISNIDTMVLEREVKGRHNKRAGEIQYLHRCAKVKLSGVTNTFDVEEVPVRPEHAKETVIECMNPIRTSFLP